MNTEDLAKQNEELRIRLSCHVLTEELNGKLAAENRRLTEKLKEPCVFLPLPGIGVLALTGDAYQEALAAGAKLSASSALSPVTTAEPLLDADQAAVQMNVTARWLEDSARAGIIPHIKLGRFIRFRVSEIANHCRVEGAP